MPRVLIVDDDISIRTHLASYVRDLDHEVEAGGDAMEALAAMDGGAFDVVFSDVRMAGMDGLALLREIRLRHPESGVILMTAYATVPDAVEAMRSGAYDYLVKPFSLEQVRLVLARLLEVQTLRHENRALREAVEGPLPFESRSPAMQQVLATARRAAVSDATILVTGESGVGKNVMAAAIHRWSPRSSRPFVTITCTTLAEHLLESELFGHVRGAFPGAWRGKPGRLEAAEGGTAFVDEVGELPPELQAKLLRFLEERRFEWVGGSETITVSTRIIAATSRDPGDEVRAGRFREDLFYRLNVIALQLPPLRGRREDLPALTDQILAALCLRHQRRGLALTPGARQAIATYPWPGNVRELINALERAVVLTGGTRSPRTSCRIRWRRPWRDSRPRRSQKSRARSETSSAPTCSGCWRRPPPSRRPRRVWGSTRPPSGASEGAGAWSDACGSSRLRRSRAGLYQRRMPRRVLPARGAIALAVALAASVRPAGAEMPRIVKHGVVSPLLARTRDRGRAPGADRHRVVVGLALRQREALEAFLADVQDPGSPRYHQFLTQDEFNAVYAPDPADEAAVVAHLAQSGLTVTERAPNRLLVGAVGSVDALERAFGVEIHALDYRGRRHYAAMGEPSLPADLAASVLGVVGLDDLVERRPRHRVVTPVAAPRAMLTSPSHCCALAPQDVANLYDDGGTYDGTGETIVIAGAYAWNDGDNIDFNAQWALPGLPAGSGQVCTGLAASAACQFSTSNSIEVALDVEYAHGVAPHARILNYMAKTTALVDFTTAYNRIVTDNPGHIVTTSWGACEADIPSGTLAADDAIFANANAIGQSWFAASGDSGSQDCNGTLSVDNPASSPHVVGVGGTTPTCSSGLTAGSPACAGYGSETAWSGSGGGISSFARPVFQTGCGLPAGSKRLVPDVALESDPSPGNYVRQASKWFIVAGTSIAAPEWAGFLAELDQRAGGAGFGNPGALFYGLCGTAAFHDITSGSNGAPDYTAAAGYDMVTGLGTISADTFFAAAVPTPGTTTTSVSTTSTTTSPTTASTTTTTPAPGSTTTTIAACPADGFSGLCCALAGGLARPECAADTLRRRIERRFRRATRLIHRAERASPPARARRLVTKAASALASSERMVKRSDVSPDCHQALVAMLEDGRERAQRLAASLQALKPL